MISKELIQQLREMERKATKGVWFARFAYQKDKNLEGLTLVGATAPGHAIVTSHDGGTSPSNDLELMVALRNNAVALITAAEECERLREEVDKLKQTSVEVERPDGSKAYVQMHCTYPHDHIANPDIGFKML